MLRPGKAPIRDLSVFRFWTRVSILRAPENQAAVIAGVLSLVGVLVGVGLERWSQDRVLQQMQRRDVAKLVSARVQGRWVRASAVINASGSSVFRNRWNEYIQGGLISWNEDYRYMKNGIKEYFPGQAGTFGAIHESFKDLHAALLTYHRTQGNPSPEAEKDAEGRLDALGRQIDVLVEGLFSSL